MVHCMRPQRFNVDPDHTKAAEQGTHWILTLKNFVETFKVEHLHQQIDKTRMIVNRQSSSVFRIISDSSS